MNVSQDNADAEAFGASLRGRSNTGSARLLAGVMVMLSAGLAYSSFKLWTDGQSAHKRLDAAKLELSEQRSGRAASNKKVAALEQQKAERDALLQQSNAKLLELNTQLAAAETRLSELDEERGEIKEQLAEFRQLTQQLKRMIDSGRLEVSFRRGRMIVELPAAVLFPSGSAELTPDGRKALTEVARILRGLRSRRFIVAGHTDNIPVATTSQFKNNWELSTARAVEVTGALVRGGLRPEQLVAAGYSEYDPVARNANEKGRQKNRRIEIILEPRLARVPGLEKAAKK